jgi:predicted Zn-dependent peptidase
MAMAEENYIGFMMMMARNLLDINAFTSFDEISDAIKAVTVSDLKKIAGEVFNKRKLSTLIMEPAAV